MTKAGKTNALVEWMADAFIGGATLASLCVEI